MGDDKKKASKEEREERKKRKEDRAKKREERGGSKRRSSRAHLEPAAAAASSSGGGAPPAAAAAAPAKPRVVQAPTEPSMPDRPDDHQLNAMFEKLMDDMGLAEQQKKAMRTFPKDRKWTLICQAKGQDASKSTTSPEYFVKMLQEDFTVKNAEQLRVSLGGESMSWLKKFVKLKGLAQFFENFRKLVDKPEKSEADLELLTECCRCAKALLNAQAGLDGVMKTPDAIETIVLSTSFVSERIQSIILEVLAALCLVSPKNHAVTYQTLEPRLPQLVESLKDRGVDMSVKASIMTVLNAIISGLRDPVKRRAFRQQYDLDNVSDGLRKSSPSESLETQLDIYDEWGADEIMEDLSVPSAIAARETVYDKLKSSVKENRRVDEELNKVMEALTLVPKEGSSAINRWELVTALVQGVAATPFSGPTRFPRDVVISVLGEEEVPQKSGEVAAIAGNVNEGEVVTKLKRELDTLSKELKDLKSRPAPEPEIIVKEVIKEVIKEVVKEVYVGGEGGAGGAPPPPPPPGGEGGPPPPPPPPGGEGGEGGGPPPPPPPPGGEGGGPPPPPPPPGGGPPPPPPPPGGGGPPPPPPPGGPGAPPPLPSGPQPNFRPKKKQPNPAVKMRGVMWSKLDDKKVDNTFWDKADDSKFHLDVKELEDLFCAAAPEKPKPLEGEGEEHGGAGGEGGGESKKKKQVVQLLDGKRYQNISIMLSRFGKRPLSDIKKAILTYDEDVLTAENVAAVREFAPLPEEIEMLKEYTGDKSSLGKPEQYVLEVMDIPNLMQKLTALYTKMNFDTRQESIRKSVDLLANAVKELNSNPHFKEMLELILAIGNYLNGGTFRGGAYGFKLDSLTKLAEVKTADNKLTMLHYLAQVCEKKYPHLLTLPEEFPSLADAVRESMPQNRTDINKINTEVKSLRTMLDSTDDPKFKAKFGEFVEGAEKKIGGVDAKLEKIEKDFKELAQFYGEPPATDSQTFFDNIFRFLCAFDIAQKDNKRRKAMAEKQAAQEQKRAELAEKQKAMGKKPIGGGTAEGPLIADKGVLDSLIANMRSGSAFVDPVEKKRQGGPDMGEMSAMFGKLKKVDRNAGGAAPHGKEEEGEHAPNFLAGLKKAPKQAGGNAPAKEEHEQPNFLTGLKKTSKAQEAAPKDEPEQPNFLAGLKKSSKPPEKKEVSKQEPNFKAGLKHVAGKTQE